MASHVTSVHNRRVLFHSRKFVRIIGLGHFTENIFLRIAILKLYPLRNTLPGNKTSSKCETQCTEGTSSQVRLGTIVFGDNILADGDKNTKLKINPL